MVATGSDEVEVSAAIVTMQAFGHGGIVSGNDSFCL